MYDSYSMATLPEMIILSPWWLFVALRFPFDYIAQYDDRAKGVMLQRN